MVTERKKISAGYIWNDTIHVNPKFFNTIYWGALYILLWKITNKKDAQTILTGVQSNKYLQREHLCHHLLGQQIARFKDLSV